MADDSSKPPLTRRVPGATRPGAASSGLPEIPEALLQRMKAVVDAAHLQEADQAQQAAAPQERAKPAQPDQSARSRRPLSAPRRRNTSPNGPQPARPNPLQRRRSGEDKPGHPPTEDEQRLPREDLLGRLRGTDRLERPPREDQQRPPREELQRQRPPGEGAQQRQPREEWQQRPPGEDSDFDTSPLPRLTNSGSIASPAASTIRDQPGRIPHPHNAAPLNGTAERAARAAAPPGRQSRAADSAATVKLHDVPRPVPAADQDVIEQPAQAPADRRRLRWPGGSKESGRRGHLLVASIVAVWVVLAVVAVALTFSSHAAKTAAPGASPTNLAAAWVAQQVGRQHVVACDPSMCRAIRADGFPASNLLVPNGHDLSRSQVVVATAALDEQFGRRLDSAYAPAVLASFGTGNAQVAIRVVARHGAAAYMSELQADHRQRESVGTALAGSSRLVIPSAARRQMASGQVDAQLLIVLTYLAAGAGQYPLHIVSFGDSGPGAGADIPLRSVYLTPPSSAAAARSMIASLRAGQAQYVPAHADLTRLHAQPVLLIEFAAPAPVGLIAGPNS